MKKFLIFALLAVLLISTVSCKKTDSAALSDNSGVGRYSDDGEDVLHYPVKYVHTYRLSMGGDYPELITISSRAELLEYIGNNSDVYNFEQSWYSVSFYDAVTEYTEDFFQTKSLVMAIIYEPSESYTHSVKQISKTDRCYSIDVIRFIPEAATDVEALWHIIIEVPKTSAILSDTNAISINVESKSK